MTTLAIILLAVATGLIWGNLLFRYYLRRERLRKKGEFERWLDQNGLVCYVDPPPGQPRTAGLYIEPLPPGCVKLEREK